MRDEQLIEYASRVPKHRQLASADWWDIARYALSGVWAVLFPIFTANAYSTVLDAGFAVVFTILIVGGSALAIYGRYRFQHTSFELAGAFASVAGWFAYALLQPITMVMAETLSRIPLLVIALIVGSFVLERTLHLVGKLFEKLGWRRHGIRIRRPFKGKKGRA